MTFKIDLAESEPEVIEADAVPTWVNKKVINGRYVYKVIPAEEALAGKEKFPLLNAPDLERIEFCKDTVRQLTDGLRN